MVTSPRKSRTILFRSCGRLNHIIVYKPNYKKILNHGCKFLGTSNSSPTLLFPERVYDCEGLVPPGSAKQIYAGSGAS